MSVCNADRLRRIRAVHLSHLHVHGRSPHVHSAAKGKHPHGHIYVHIWWKQLMEEYCTENGTFCQWSVVLLVAALFWSWSLQVISILYPLWFSKNVNLFCDISANWNSPVMNAEVARIIRTPDRSENIDPFSLQNMMSFHNVDEICRCLLST